MSRSSVAGSGGCSGDRFILSTCPRPEAGRALDLVAASRRRAPHLPTHRGDQGGPPRRVPALEPVSVPRGRSSEPRRRRRGLAPRPGLRRRDDPRRGPRGVGRLRGRRSHVLESPRGRSSMSSRPPAQLPDPRDRVVGAVRGDRRRRGSPVPRSVEGLLPPRDRGGRSSPGGLPARGPARSAHRSRGRPRPHRGGRRGEGGRAQARRPSGA